MKLPRNRIDGSQAVISSTTAAAAATATVVTARASSMGKQTYPMQLVNVINKQTSQVKAVN